MAWTDITREQHKRAGLRYPGDLTDAEWALIAPLFPPARSGGRPRTTDLREVVNAILYLASSGCQWRMLPKDFPPLSTVQGYFYDWRNMGLWQSINHLLVMAARERLTITQVPIATVYIENNRDSHFNPLLDSIRIDYVFIDRALTALATDVDCDYRGDHCILRARLAVP